jgi:hypothetical protein
MNDPPGGDTCAHCFSQRSQDKGVTEPKNVLQKINPYNISHTVDRLLQLLLDAHTFLVVQKHVPTSYHGQPGGLITRPLEIDRDPTKTRNVTDHGK